MQAVQSGVAGLTVERAQDDLDRVLDAGYEPNAPGLRKRLLPQTSSEKLRRSTASSLGMTRTE